MSIGELSAKSGVPASTLRYWERVKVLPRPMRVHGQRRYLPEALSIVAVLRLAKACGFTLTEMRELLNGLGPEAPAPARWKRTARLPQERLAQQMTQLEATRKLLGRVVECRCRNLVDCGRLASALLIAESSCSGR